MIDVFGLRGVGAVSYQITIKRLPIALVKLFKGRDVAAPVAAEQGLIGRCIA